MEMIDLASRQLAELLDELGTAARIEGGATSRACRPSRRSSFAQALPIAARRGPRQRQR
jgi:hypothetical protein